MEKYVLFKVWNDMTSFIQRCFEWSVITSLSVLQMIDYEFVAYILQYQNTRIQWQDDKRNLGMIKKKKEKW